MRTPLRKVDCIEPHSLLASLRTYARGREENFFTDCLAHALAVDPPLARAFATRICGKTLEGRRISSATIAFQTRVYVGRLIPDLIMWVNDAPIAIEHKLFAGQGDGQLEKYIADDRFVRLAYIAGYHDPRVRVAGHHRYLRPASSAQSHFVWWDFFDMIRTAGTRTQRTSPVRQSLLRLFRDLGFEPVHGALGDLTDPDESVRSENRKKFAALWGETRSRLNAAGWGYFMQKSDAWVNDAPSGSTIRKVWLTPHTQPGMLLVRLFTDSRAAAARVRRRLEIHELPHRSRIVITEQGPAVNKGRHRWSVTAGVSLQTLFGKRCENPELGRRLADFCTPVIDAAR